ncbi:MAG: hypothetical protein ACOC8B_05100 [Gemmatimonadota bacterium]
MPRDFELLPGVDIFWEQADRDDSAEHPLERELGDRLDAMARYRRMIAEAQASGRERAAELLLQQHGREAEQADRLRDAIRRMNGRGPDDGPAVA